MKNSREKSIGMAIGAALFAVTLLVFLPTLKNDFINFDDPGYVTGNFHVRKGLTAEAVGWAFATSHTGNWHPLTWLSHMLDCELYGLKPAGHHFTNILFHAASAALLFGLLRRATGAVWRSAFVAGFFALHPLRVESVAWVAERKDVLSTFFFMLTLWAYVKYVKSGESKIQSPKSKLHYTLALGFFVLGLMSKPMLVTVPFVLLLLDYWPLQRFSFREKKLEPPILRRLVLEKLPFLLLAVVSALVTFQVQSQGGNTVKTLGLPYRVANSLISYAAYLKKMLWPSDLSIFYPREEILTIVNAALAALVLVFITAFCFWLGRSRRYLLTGWLWYVVMLGPVCGLIAIGAHALADRYTYLPGIGVVVAVVWGVAEIARRWPRGQRNFAIIGAVTLVACGVSTMRELRYWKSNRTLFERALEVTPSNEIALVNVSAALAVSGDREKAIEYARRAVEIRPRFNDGWNQLAVLLAETGRPQEGLEAATTAINLEPDFAAAAYYNRGTIWLDLGQPDKARADFESALKQNPEYSQARINLAALLGQAGDPDAAIRELRTVVRLDPENHAAQYNLASALSRKGLGVESIVHYEHAIRLGPTNAGAFCNLGLMQLQLNQEAQALTNFHEALRLNPSLPQAHYGMGAWFNRRGQTAEAIAHFQRALQPAANFPAALNDLAAIYAAHPDARFRNGTEAVRLAEHLCQLSGKKNPSHLNILAAAYAETGDFTNAIAAAEQAASLARAAGQTDLANRCDRLLEQFRAGQPARGTIAPP